jgi:hypothetical protein
MSLTRCSIAAAAAVVCMTIAAPETTSSSVDRDVIERIERGVKTGNLNWGEDGSVLYLAANHRILRVRATTRGLVGRK